MTPERWERVKTLYEAARAYPHRHRSSFLAKECNGDTDLQLEVEALLDQLAVGGRMVLPVGDAEHQELLRLVREPTGIRRERLMDVRFVPMTRGAETR